MNVKKNNIQENRVILHSQGPAHKYSKLHIVLGQRLEHCICNLFLILA